MKQKKLLKVRFLPKFVSCNLQALLFFVFSITFLGTFLIQDHGQLLNIAWDSVKNRKIADNVTDSTVWGSWVQRCIWWDWMSLAELSMFGFGWSAIEPVCQYCVDNHLRCDCIFIACPITIKAKANKAYPIFDGKCCPVFSNNLIGNVSLGMYFISQINSF